MWFFLAGVLGCGPPGDLLQWQVVPTEVPTVLKVDWSLKGEGTVQVEFGEGDCDRTAPPQDGTEEETLLLGLGARTDVCVRLVVAIDGVEQTSEERILETGILERVVPELQVSAFEPDLVEPGFLLLSTAMNPGARFVVDRTGKVLWSHAVEPGRLSPQISVEAEGAGFLSNEFSEYHDVDIGLVRLLNLAGETEWTQRTELAHHAFEQLPDGTLAFLAINVRDTEEFGSVVGDSIIELSPDGTEREVWNVWNHMDHFPLETNNGWDLGFYPQGKDWSHGNSLRYDEALDTYTLSFRNLDTILEIERSTGAHLRSFGRYGTVQVPEDEALIGAPHGAHWTSSNTLLFLTSPPGTGVSRAVELEVGEDSAEILWSWGEGQGLKALIMGEAERLPGGNTLVNFGSKGTLVEVTPGGEVAWRAELEAGNWPGHASVFADWYDLAGD